MTNFYLWVDHVEDDVVSDPGVAVPEPVDEGSGDTELYVGDKQCHGDRARPSAVEIICTNVITINRWGNFKQITHI